MRLGKWIRRRNQRRRDRRHVPTHFAETVGDTVGRQGGGWARIGASTVATTEVYKRVEEAGDRYTKSFADHPGGPATWEGKQPPATDEDTPPDQ